MMFPMQDVVVDCRGIAGVCKRSSRISRARTEISSRSDLLKAEVAGPSGFDAKLARPSTAARKPSRSRKLLLRSFELALDGKQRANALLASLMVRAKRSYCRRLVSAIWVRHFTLRLLADALGLEVFDAYQPRDGAQDTKNTHDTRNRVLGASTRQDAEFLACMEECSTLMRKGRSALRAVYGRTPVHLLKETRVPTPRRRRGTRVDYEYDRHGTATFPFPAPLSGFRQATRPPPRTKVDWAREVAQR